MVRTRGEEEALDAHDVLLLNRHFRKKDEWTSDSIQARAETLIDAILQIWPVPPNHHSGFKRDRPRIRRRVQLSDLVTGGMLEPGTTLFARSRKERGRVATVLADGKVDVDGVAFSTPSKAASAMTGKVTNGWWFFLIDQASKRSLRTLRREYIEAMAVDADDDEVDDDSGEDEDDEDSWAEIQFVERSSFLPTIADALDDGPGYPRVGEPIQVSLRKGGYAGRGEIEIMANHKEYFLADWRGTDSTRFPVRIRAAATALRDRKCFGRFAISHEDGLLVIDPLP